MSRGVEGECRGSVCLLTLPIGTAVFQTVADVDSQTGGTWPDNSFGLFSNPLLFLNKVYVCVTKLTLRVQHGALLFTLLLYAHQSITRASLPARFSAIYVTSLFHT